MMYQRYQDAEGNELEPEPCCSSHLVTRVLTAWSNRKPRLLAVVDRGLYLLVDMYRMLPRDEVLGLRLRADTWLWGDKAKIVRADRVITARELLRDRIAVEHSVDVMFRDIRDMFTAKYHPQPAGPNLQGPKL
jgi:hypothetical protein